MVGQAPVVKPAPSQMAQAPTSTAVSCALSLPHACAPLDPLPPAGVARDDGPRPLEDEVLRDEIELLLELIVIASEYPGHLTPRQVDAALRLAPSPGQRADRAHQGRGQPD